MEIDITHHMMQPFDFLYNSGVPVLDFSGQSVCVAASCVVVPASRSIYFKTMAL